MQSGANHGTGLLSWKMCSCTPGMCDFLNHDFFFFCFFMHTLSWHERNLSSVAEGLISMCSLCINPGRNSFGSPRKPAQALFSCISTWQIHSKLHGRLYLGRRGSFYVYEARDVKVFKIKEWRFNLWGSCDKGRAQPGRNDQISWYLPGQATSYDGVCNLLKSMAVLNRAWRVDLGSHFYFLSFFNSVTLPLLSGRMGPSRKLRRGDDSEGRSSL